MYLLFVCLSVCRQGLFAALGGFRTHAVCQAVLELRDLLASPRVLRLKASATTSARDWSSPGRQAEVLNYTPVVLHPPLGWSLALHSPFR